MLSETEHELSNALKVALQVGNPPQLWKTYAVMGDLRQAQDRPNDANRAYADAYKVVEEVAAELKNRTLRDMFMRSQFVREIRRKIIYRVDT